MEMSDVNRIIEEAAFAKEVETADGPAILIAGEVIHIRSAAPKVHVEAIVTALRMKGRDNATSLQASS